MQAGGSDFATSKSGLSRERRRYHLEQILPAVLAEEKLEDPRWTSLAVVFSTTARGRNFGNSGYVYGDGDDWWPISFSVIETKPPVVAFIRDTHGDIGDSLCRVLLQYDRKTRRALLSSEVGNPERWSITPDNARQLLVELKPDFEALA